MGFTTGGADHPLDVEDRSREGILSPVGAMSDEPAFTVTIACPVSYCLQVNVHQLSGIVNLCNWYIDKVARLMLMILLFYFGWEWRLALPLSKFYLKSLLAIGKTLLVNKPANLRTISFNTKAGVPSPDIMLDLLSYVRLSWSQH